MFENFTPPEKKAYHSTFTKYWIIVVSFLGSLTFVNFLLFGAIFYHLRQKLSGEEKFNEPDAEALAGERYTPREAYPNLKKLKPTKDLGYYARQLGLDLEEHTITTKDGYILTLHHLIDPKDTPEQRDGKKPILLQHGLLSCSGAYITSGTNSLAYYFIEQGYDVWLGNNRSGFEARHAEYTGNLMHDEKYWDWDIRELAYYDLPCIIDNVLANKPHHEKLYLVGHSQGCTQSFLMLRNGDLKHTHGQIEYFFCLAPAIFPGKLFHERSFIKFIHHRSPLGYKLLFGTCSFLRNLCYARYALGTTKIFGTISYIMFKYLFGWTGTRWGHHKKVWHFHFIFNVTYVSSKLMNWWLSEWVEEGFSNQLQTKEAYATGANSACTPVNSNEGENVRVEHKDDLKTYFPYKEAWFDFNEHKNDVVPMLIFTCDEDYLVDGDRLATHMKHYEREYYKVGENLDVVALKGYNHLDIVWAIDLIGRVGMVINDKLKAIAAQPHAKPVVDEVNEKVQAPVLDPVPVSFDPRLQTEGRFDDVNLGRSQAVTA